MAGKKSALCTWGGMLFHNHRWEEAALLQLFSGVRDKKFRLVAMGGWDESSMLHTLETPVSSP